MPHTLLLADDSVTIQRVIELTFADEDIRVIAVGDGDRAIAAVDENPPDIVLADVGMPGRSGYEVAQHIRDTPRLAHIPVLLLTGAFEPIDQSRASEVGCDGVLAKPFEPQQVIGRVKDLLAKPRTGATGATGAPAGSAGPAIVPQNPFDQPQSRAATSPEPADSYFDRLDDAFASLAAGKDHARPAPSSTDWFGGHRPESAHTAPEVPLSYGSPQSAFDAPPAAPSTGYHETSHAAAVAEKAPSAAAGAAMPPDSSVAAVSAPAVDRARAVLQPAGASASGHLASATGFPPLADAFAALLAAEQGIPPANAPVWPGIAPLVEPAPPPAIDMEAIVAQVTRRVLEHLSDRIVRETVTDIVSTVTERLVREEIDRIKQALK